VARITLNSRELHDRIHELERDMRASARRIEQLRNELADSQRRCESLQWIVDQEQGDG